MIVTVFRSRLAEGVQSEYSGVAHRMSELAREVPGYISHKSFTAEDGERVTIVEFENEEALQAWKVHPEHRQAKKLGFTSFFRSFSYQICEVIGGRSWESKSASPHPLA